MTIKAGDQFRIKAWGGVWTVVATAVQGVFALVGPDRRSPDDPGPFIIRERITGRLELHDDTWPPGLWIGLNGVERVDPMD